MIKKTLITVVVIVAILGIVFAAYGNNNTKNSTNTSNSTNPQKVIDKVNKTTNNNNSPTTITPTEAQKIAKTFIEVSGATAGTPKLINQEGTLMYIVPVINNNTVVGEIDIDAKTGKNLGGAGGAP